MMRSPRHLRYAPSPQGPAMSTTWLHWQECCYHPGPMRPTRDSTTIEPQHGFRFPRAGALLVFAAFFVALPSSPAASPVGGDPSAIGESASPVGLDQVPAPVEAPVTIEPVEAAAPNAESQEADGATADTSDTAVTQAPDAADGSDASDASQVESGTDEGAEDALAKSATDGATDGETPADTADGTVAGGETAEPLFDFDDYFAPYDPYDNPGLDEPTGVASTEEKDAPQAVGSDDVPGKDAVAAAEAEEPTGTPRVLPVAVVVEGNALAQAARVQEILNTVLQGDDRFEALDSFAIFDPMGLEYRKDQQERGSDALRHGREAFDSLDLDLGVEFLERSISAFEESALWETFPSLVDAMALRIIIRWSDDLGRSRSDIEKLVAIAPEVEFPFELTPGDLQAEVQRAKENLLGTRRYNLDVNTSPVSARVYVNGEFKGYSPLTVRGLVKGEHYVSLVAPGYRVDQQRVPVGAGASHSVTLAHADRSAPFHTYLARIIENFGEDLELPHAQNLARVADADQLLVAGVSREQGRIRLDLHRVARSDGHVLAMESAQFAENAPDLDERIEAMTFRVLARDRARQSNGDPRTFKSGFAAFVESITPSEPTLRIGTLALSGALLVAGGTVGIVAQKQHSDFRALPQTSPELDARISSGRAAAITSDILIGLGLVAGGTWAWLQFGRKDATPPPASNDPLIDSVPVAGPPVDDDPFASLPQPAAPVSSAPAPVMDDVMGSISVFASPALEGGVLGLKGSF